MKNFCKYKYRSDNGCFSILFDCEISLLESLA